MAQLKIAPSSELVPFVGAVGWTLEVDGKLWAHERFGGIEADGGLAVYGPFENSRPGRRVDQVVAYCTSGELGRELSAGPHTASLTAQLAGGGKLPAQEVSFELNCGPFGGCASVSPSQLAVPFVALSLLLLRARARARARARGRRPRPSSGE